MLTVLPETALCFFLFGFLPYFGRILNYKLVEEGTEGDLQWQGGKFPKMGSYKPFPLTRKPPTMDGINSLHNKMYNLSRACIQSPEHEGHEPMLDVKQSRRQKRYHNLQRAKGTKPISTEGYQSTGGVVCMISATHYVIYGSFVTNDTVLKVLQFSLETGSGYNIISRKSLPFGWHTCVQTQGEVPCLNNVN